MDSHAHFFPVIVGSRAILRSLQIRLYPQIYPCYCLVVTMVVVIIAVVEWSVTQNGQYRS